MLFLEEGQRVADHINSRLMSRYTFALVQKMNTRSQVPKKEIINSSFLFSTRKKETRKFRAELLKAWLALTIG